MRKIDLDGAGPGGGGEVLAQGTHYRGDYAGLGPEHEALAAGRIGGGRPASTSSSGCSSRVRLRGR